MFCHRICQRDTALYVFYEVADHVTERGVLDLVAHSAECTQKGYARAHHRAELAGKEDEVGCFDLWSKKPLTALFNARLQFDGKWTEVLVAHERQGGIFVGSGQGSVNGFAGTVGGFVGKCRHGG